MRGGGQPGYEEFDQFDYSRTADGGDGNGPPRGGDSYDAY